MNTMDYSKFANLNYDEFRRRARDPSLSVHEKVGFPDAYRDGKEPDILRDCLRKLPRLDGTPGALVEIGPGCATLPRLLSQFAKERGHRLVFIDSEEMLCQLPDDPHVSKRFGRFPECALGL
jgi:hypothetical protein